MLQQTKPSDASDDARGYAKEKSGEQHHELHGVIRQGWSTWWRRKIWRIHAVGHRGLQGTASSASLPCLPPRMGSMQLRPEMHASLITSPATGRCYARERTLSLYDDQRSPIGLLSHAETCNRRTVSNGRKGTGTLTLAGRCSTPLGLCCKQPPGGCFLLPPF